MFSFFKKNDDETELTPIICANEDIVAPADAKMISIDTVKDDVFAKKMIGDGVAFEYTGKKVTICAPANGSLSVLFPTAHAFGVKMKNGIELLIHIGINTVESKGVGFKVLSKKLGDEVRAGDPIVTVDLKRLGSEYDMTTMLIVTNGNDQSIVFKDPDNVIRGQIINK